MGHQIPAIVLNQGSSEDIERTGHGCIMNVIAYLQGEPITDRPQGVDDAFRTLAIYCNDHLAFGPRQALLMPLVSRLMNTKTDSWHELAMRMERLLRLEREVCGATFPMTGFLEHMGPNLAQRIDCLVKEIVGAAERRQMWEREHEVCVAIVAALDDMLPASELNPKQRRDMDDLGAVVGNMVAANRKTWAMLPDPPGLLPWFGKPWKTEKLHALHTLQEVFKPLEMTAVWVDESETIGAPT